MNPIIVVFHYKESKEFDYEVVLPKEGINIRKEYDSFIFYNPNMLNLTNEFCLDYLELEKNILKFYQNHPYSMNDEQQAIIDTMENEIKKMEDILVESINNLES